MFGSDNAVEAFGSLDWDSWEPGEVSGYVHDREACDFEYDPLYYHTKIKIKGIEHETAGAYLFKSKKGNFWVPKALCKKLKKKSVYILDRFEIHYLPTTS
jgi:hypothetical protein